MKTKNGGFTLIELVIVIIVLGVLSVTALPKFLDIGQDAHDATAKSSFAAFDSAVKLYHSCWLTNGKSGAVQDLACFGDGDIDSSTTGYPLAQSDISNGTKLQGDYCEEMWTGLLSHNDFKLEGHNNSGGYDDDTSIVYWYAGSEMSNPRTYCYYNYIADDRSKGAVNWQLHYYPATGETTITRGALSY
ncbi:type II secretion system protein [Moritella sp. F3]|uniref:type II secretion system protein n=1 Tax=Moritella sp. F3 TaxID=2718882 RepID=UPI0018E1724B|nr:type II secretion system protein [Moritella sp. F3]GIC78188.1 PilD processed protein [Moritella sp. F1]GIC81168.1 PilD processed protein [Moritella sp. F3]